MPILALVMTEKGLISRLLCPKFGGYLTFGTLGAGKESAPGQPTLKDLIDTYKIRSLGRDTKVFGLIGNPVGHSKGPILHNQAFRESGVDAIYVPFLVDNIAEFLKVYSSPDFAGFRCDTSAAYKKHHSWIIFLFLCILFVRVRCIVQPYFFFDKIFTS